MQKKTQKKPQITEKIQVGCTWKLAGIFDNHHGRRPDQKLLSNPKHEKRVIEAESIKGRSNCQGNANASGNKIVAVNNGKRNVTKLIEENGDMHKVAMEILDSNHELFLRLLKDPKSLIVKQIQRLEDLQTKKERIKSLYEDKLSKCGISAVPKKCQKSEHTVRKSVLQRIKSQYGCPSAKNDIPSTSNSIVILEPRHKKRGSNNFGKHGDLELKTKPGTRERFRQKVDLPTVSCINQRDLEAKIHLSRRLRDVENSECLSVKQAPRTLKSILSSPDDDFLATISPNSDVNASVSTQMSFSGPSNFQLAGERNGLSLQTKEVSTFTDYMKPDDQVQNFESKSEILEAETVYSTDALRNEAYVNTTVLTDAIKSRAFNLSEMPSEQNVLVDNAQQRTNTPKIREENRYMECCIQDSRLENEALNSSSIVNSSNNVNIYKNKYDLEIEDCKQDREEHLSPVSVLEPLFTEDCISPGKPPMKPRRIDFGEDSLVADCIDSRVDLGTCIRTLFQASGLNWDERNLFLDFINEVLLELHQRRLERRPWTTSIGSDIQSSKVMAKHLIEELTKEVDWYLVPSVIPRTMEHLTVRDVKKSESWSYRRYEIEEIGIQLVDDVLDELIMEAIFVI